MAAAARNICTVYENPFAIWTDETPKQARVFTTYEVTWETSGKGARDFLGHKRDFPLMQDISNWLLDLTHFNTDDTSLIAKDWHLVHITPGHLFIFLMLCAKDHQERIRYPFKSPVDGWSSRPLPSAMWIEHRPIDYWDFMHQRERFLSETAFAKTHIRIV